MTRVNVSSVLDFMQCRFRWWCKWVKNRVPVNEMPALGAGKLLHTIFEDAFNGKDIAKAALDRCTEYEKMIMTLPVAAQVSQQKALRTILDLIDALPMWHSTFNVDEVLEVEQPFEWEHNGILWIGRPDVRYRDGRTIWHRQNRGLAAGTNFGTYLRLAQRLPHEHLYAAQAVEQYCGKGSKLKYGGTDFNLVRKLKYRTNVGKKNEATKTYEEMFYQQKMAIDVKGKVHQVVMHQLEQHVHEMERVIREWEDDEIIPPPNDKMNGGFSGNSEDPYFRVLIGEITLEDDTVFKDREDTYAITDPTE